MRTQLQKAQRQNAGVAGSTGSAATETSHPQALGATGAHESHGCMSCPRGDGTCFPTFQNSKREARLRRPSSGLCLLRGSSVVFTNQHHRNKDPVALLRPAALHSSNRVPRGSQKTPSPDSLLCGRRTLKQLEEKHASPWDTVLGLQVTPPTRSQ